MSNENSQAKHNPRGSTPEENLKLGNCWHLFTRQTSVVEPEESIRTALKIMAHRGFRHLPVIKRERGRELLGVISAQDIINLIFASYHSQFGFSEDQRGANCLLSQFGESVSKIMSDKPITITRNDSILDAITIMSRNNIGALPIIEEKENRRKGELVTTSMPEPGKQSLVGIITLRDIIGILAAYAPFGVRVEDYMTSKVYSIVEDDTIFSAVSIMSKKRVRRLPVVSGKREDLLEGMLTNKMILRLIESCLTYNHLNIGMDTACDQLVRITMISRMPLIDPMEDCGDAAYLMRELGTGGFAVSDSRGLLGVITERDLVKRIFEKEGISFFTDLFYSKPQTLYT